MIYGLEAAYYAVHRPTPVRVTPEMYPNMTMRTYVNGQMYYNYYDPKLNQIDGEYKIDLSPWVLIGMAKLLETKSYTNVIVNYPDPYISEVEVIFVEDNGLTGDTFEQGKTVKFIQATEISIDNIPYPGKAIKVWKCYPFSWRYQPEVLRYVIVTALNFTVPGRTIEYIDECCKGTYVKWLNEYGHYNYWLFPFIQEFETDSENIYDVPRNIFDTDKTSNYDSIGFTSSKKLTIRDKVKEMYWFMFECLTWSPEVYILRNDWALGSASCGVNDWIKVRQTDVTFTRIVGQRSMADVEFEFELPKPYTIQSI